MKILRLNLTSDVFIGKVLERPEVPDSGVRYEELPELYQIFISRNDFLHTGKAIVYNRKPYPDGVTEVYFNLFATGDTDPAVRKLQKYFLETIPENESRHFPNLVARVNFLKYQEKGVGEMCEIFDEVRREGEQEGRTEAWRDTILDLLNPLGRVSEEVMKRVQEQSDESCLRNWIRVAAHASSVEEFAERM